MGRSGYTDNYGDDDPLAMGRWRSAVRSAMNGRRGQAFLKEMLTALDALSEKRLCREELEIPVTGLPFALRGGEVCALGAVGRIRGIDMAQIDPYDAEILAGKFGIADAMVREIANENDEYYHETPERRFVRMRQWIVSRIRSNTEN